MTLVSVDGYYIFPTDIGPLQMLKLTVNVSKNLIQFTPYISDLRTELANVLNHLELSTIAVYQNPNYFNCNTPIGLSVINSGLELRKSGAATWYAYLNNSNIGMFTIAGGGSSVYTCAYNVIIQCTDGYALGNDAIYTYDSSLISVVLPENNDPGFFVRENIASYGISVLSDNTRLAEIINDYFTANPPQPAPIQPTDPYSPGGTSEGEIGGSGDFDDTSEPIDFPSLPTIGAVDSGFITIFNPTLAEVKSLATYMWNNPLFDLTTWKKIFADPMDAILGLSLIPVTIPDAGARAINVGNIATDVTMNVAAAQFIEIQCGSINVNEYWGAYLDYSPYTKVEIYLPYCGTHQLSIDDVMNKTLEVRYHVDILSGACCAYVKCGESVLYTFLGQCSSSIPIAANDFTSVINGVLSAAVSIGSMVATGGLSAPLAVPQLASTAVNAMKENVEKSGAISGTGGLLAIQKPYIILTRPRQALPENQNAYTGYPSFITAVLGDLSGYTEIEQIHLHDVPATGEEIVEIEKLLKTGVIL